jgi:hypothetical protein
VPQLKGLAGELPENRLLRKLRRDSDAYLRFLFTSPVTSITASALSLLP